MYPITNLENIEYINSSDNEYVVDQKVLQDLVDVSNEEEE